MNWDVVLRYLTEYRTLVDQACAQPLLSKERRTTLKAANSHVPMVNVFLRALAPDLQLINAQSVNDHVAARPCVERALKILQGWEQMASQQWTGGGPALPLSLLDPVVRHVALPLWGAGKYRQAVSDAATSVNSFAQTKIGRHDISDKDLMTQAFSEKDPEPGKSRLRCPGNPASETVRSQQDGARAFALGTFQAIRNPAHHLTGDWNPVTAFHHLTALSQVAHYFRDWEVHRYVPPLPDSTMINAVLEQYIKAQKQSGADLTPPTER